MFKGACLLVFVKLLAGVVVLSSGSIYPVDEMSASRTSYYNSETVPPCIHLGYDVIYQDSSFDQNSDDNVHDMAHCAIDRCSEAVKWKPKANQGMKQIWSDLAESFYSCLVAMQDCAKPGRKKEEF